MKTRFIIFGFLLSFTCCSDDSESSVKQTVINTITNGTWVITCFFDSGTDKTSNYDGYNFTFSNSNVLTVKKGSNTYTGTWNISDDNTSENTLGDLHFNIACSTPPLLEELSNDWNITESANVRIVLIDISGGGSGTDYLTFEKY